MEQTLKLQSLNRSEVNLQFSEQGVREIEALSSHYPTLKACILPALWLAQREYGGYLSGDAIAEVAYRLKRPFAEVEGVATFYTMYNTAHKPGKHKLELCTCLSCSVNGTYELRDYIVEKLGVRHGETTEDGLFTFEEVECLDACDRAPVMQVGDQYYGPVDTAFFDRLVDDLRRSEESTVVQLARTLVAVQLREGEAGPSDSETAVPLKNDSSLADTEAAGH